MAIQEKKAITKIGQRIKKLRKEQGITQAQLAFETGIPREQVGRIERAQINTSIGNIIAICRVLDIHPKELLDFEV